MQVVSSSNNVCPKGFYVAYISTILETDNPEFELKPAVDLMGDIMEMFVSIQPVYEPVDDGRQDNVSIIARICFLNFGFINYDL